MRTNSGISSLWWWVGRKSGWNFHQGLFGRRKRGVVVMTTSGGDGGAIPSEEITQRDE